MAGPPLLLVAAATAAAAFLVATAEGASIFDKRAALASDLNTFSLYDVKNKRPFCNAFTGCGYKRSDPLLSSSVIGLGSDDNDSSDDNDEQDEAKKIDKEARKLGERMLIGDFALDAVQNRINGVARLRPEGNQFGFFPGYLK